MFTGRSTLDVIAILFAVAVAWAIVAAGATIALLALTDRSDDAADVVGYFESAITTIVGAMLGLIAGRVGGRESKETARLRKETAMSENRPERDEEVDDVTFRPDAVKRPRHVEETTKSETEETSVEVDEVDEDDTDDDVDDTTQPDSPR